MAASLTLTQITSVDLVHPQSSQGGSGEAAIRRSAMTDYAIANPPCALRQVRATEAGIRFRSRLNSKPYASHQTRLADRARYRQRLFAAPK
jgi:hypothetical protein